MCPSFRIDSTLVAACAPYRVYPVVMLLMLALVLASLVVGGDARAQASAAVPNGAVASVVTASGDSQLLRTSALVSPIRAGTTLTTGDRLQTRADGRVELRFTDGSVVALQPNTDFRIDDYRLEAGEQRNFMSLLRGALRAVSGAIGRLRRDEYRLTTPSAVIGIRGTEYEVNETVCPPRGCDAGVRAGLAVRVIQGRVSVSNDSGSIEVPTGGSVFVADRQAVPMPLRPSGIPAPAPALGQPVGASAGGASAPVAPASAASSTGGPPAAAGPGQAPSPWMPSAPMVSPGVAPSAPPPADAGPKRPPN